MRWISVLWCYFIHSLQLVTFAFLCVFTFLILIPIFFNDIGANWALDCILWCSLKCILPFCSLESFFMVNQFARASNISIAEFQVYLVLTVQEVMLNRDLSLSNRKGDANRECSWFWFVNRFLYMIIVAFPFLIGAGFLFPYNQRIPFINVPSGFIVSIWHLSSHCRLIRELVAWFTMAIGVEAWLVSLMLLI